MTTYYSSHNAAGGGAGTIGDPYTLQELADNVTSADLGLIMATGTYTPSAKIDFDTNTGTASARVTLRGANADGSDDGTKAFISGTSLPATTNLIDITSSVNYLLIENLDVADATDDNIYNQGSRNQFNNVDSHDAAENGYNGYFTRPVHFYRCRFYDNGNDGATGLIDNSARITADRCEFVGNGRRGCRSLYGQGAVFTNCLFADNVAYGLSISMNNTEAQAYIANCTFHNNGDEGIQISNTTSSSNVTITYSLFTDNGTYGIVALQDLPYVTTEHCAFYNNNSGAVDYNSGTPYGENTVTDQEPLYISSTILVPQNESLIREVTTDNGTDYRWPGAFQRDQPAELDISGVTPEVTGSTSGSQTSASTTWNVDVPASSYLDYVFLFVVVDNTATNVTTPSGWKEMLDWEWGEKLHVFFKRSTNEPANSFNITLDASQDGAWASYVIRNVAEDTWRIDRGSSFSASVVFSDAMPPYTTPKNALYIAVGVGQQPWDGTFPTDYDDNQIEVDAGGTFRPGIILSTKTDIDSGGAEQPSQYTMTSAGSYGTILMSFPAITIAEEGTWAAGSTVDGIFGDYKLMHWDAADLADGDANDITGWLDRVESLGWTINGTPIQNDDYKSTGFRAAELDGVGDYFELSNAIANVSTGVGLIIVHHENVAATSDTLFSWFTSSTDYMRLMLNTATAGDIRIQHRNTSVVNTGGTGARSGICVTVARFDIGLVQAMTAYDCTGATITDDLAVTNDIFLGAQGTPANYYDGGIFEVILVDLNAGWPAMLAAATVLRNKYNVTHPDTTPSDCDCPDGGSGGNVIVIED